MYVDQTRLKKLCRMSGCSLKHSRSRYDSTNRKDELMVIFHLDNTGDSTTTRPGQFCETCRTVLTKSKKAAMEGKVYMHNIKNL